MFYRLSKSLNITWATLKSYGVGERLTQLLKYIGERSQVAVKIGNESGEPKEHNHRYKTRRSFITLPVHHIPGKSAG